MSGTDITDPARVRAVLTAVLAAEGVVLTDVAVSDVYARPGAETSVRVTALTSAGPRDLVLTDAALEPSARVVRVEADSVAYAVWLHPFDPMLPDLASAVDPEWLSRALGIRIDAAELIVYRPLRRAVVRATGEAEMYLKVVRPSRAHLVTDAAAALGVATPQVVQLAPGIVAAPVAHGVPLIQLVASPDVTAAQVDAVVCGALASLPDAVAGLPNKPSWVERREIYAAHARRRGLDADQIDAVVGADLGEAQVNEPTHGDLHLTNVRFTHGLEGPEFAAVIDVDSAGPGAQADDLACMVAHIAALEALDPELYQHTTALAVELARLWLPRAPALHARAAAVLLTLSSTHDDPAVAKQWLAAAARLAVTNVRELSRTSPRGLRGELDHVRVEPHGSSHSLGR